VTTPPSSSAGAAAASLGRRLSLWLALQGLLAALLVSAAVYATNYWVLQSRQEDELRTKRDVVRHALAETAATANAAELKHRLDDFLAGHEDMDVTVRASDRRLLYRPMQRSRGEPPAGRVLVVAWADRWPASADGAVEVRLSMDVRRDDALLQRLGLAVLAASLLGAALVSLTGLVLVRKGLRPVRQLVAQVEALELDRSGLRLDNAGQPRELLPLVDRFNTLLVRVERAYSQLEAFNADVAHELRTPLTTLIGASELALKRNRPVEELRDVIAGNLEDLRRLATVVNDMLFLSHADRGAAARTAPVPSLSAALLDIVDYHEAALHERNLKAVCEGDIGGAFDVALLRRALSNLLSNAGRYATPGSTIRVLIEPRHGHARLCVRNEGLPIAPEHLPRLFDRFFRVETSRSHTGHNHGLGLAIVAAIARMHGGEPFAQSEGGVTTIGMDIPVPGEG
jgi:two-component system heavy metal sensor histidine kinase CusS